MYRFVKSVSRARSPEDGPRMESFSCPGCGAPAPLRSGPCDWCGRAIHIVGDDADYWASAGVRWSTRGSLPFLSASMGVLPYESMLVSAGDRR